MKSILKSFLILLLSLFTPLFSNQERPIASGKIVELVTTFIPDPQSVAAELTQALAERNSSLTVVATDMTHYGKAFPKNRTRLGKWLRKMNWDFPKQIPVKDSVDKIVFWNISTQYARHSNLGKLPKEKLILFMWEPPTCLRSMFEPAFHSHFSKIYTWDDDLVDNQHYFKFFYPVLKPMISNLPSFEEKKLCTLVATHIVQTGRWRYPKELYSEREKAITYFEQQGEKGFEFYGRLWDVQTHPSYKGVIDDKIEVIKNYRFTICYENTQEVRGYITEKIFDCFAAGNVPIYWGASNIAEYIPKTCFIDRRDFASMEDLHAYIKTMPKERYEAYLEAIRNFLSSPKAQLFSKEHYLQTVCDALSS